MYFGSTGALISDLSMEHCPAMYFEWLKAGSLVIPKNLHCLDIILRAVIRFSNPGWLRVSYIFPYISYSVLFSEPPNSRGKGVKPENPPSYDVTDTQG